MNNFGYGYQPLESNSLPAGIYQARITKCEYRDAKGYTILDVYVDIQGHPNAKPDRFSFFDRPGNNEPDKQRGWDYSMTQFFDSFHINRGDFNILNWRGRNGFVRVVQRKDSNYMDMYPYLPKENEQGGQAAQQGQQQRSQQPQQQNGYQQGQRQQPYRQQTGYQQGQQRQGYQPQPPQDQQGYFESDADNFDDDIPF